MKDLPRFEAIGQSSSRFWLYFIEFRGERAYMTTDGAGAYLVSPGDGACEGVEGTRGQKAILAPSAWRRLHKMYRNGGERIPMDNLPERTAVDGAMAVNRHENEIYIAVAHKGETRNIVVSSYNAARLIVALCVFMELPAPRALRKLRMT